MSEYVALRKLRVGCVQYLNSRPLIEDYSGTVLFEHPAVLADMLSAEALDVALVPVFEAVRQGKGNAVDGVAIASFGEVFSVYLAFTGHLRDVKEIYLDPASRTSIHLLQVLLSEFHQMTPRYIQGDPNPPLGAARLLIGNQAIHFRLQADEEVKILDLGAEWTMQTGLPFVFALWLFRAGLSKVHAPAKDLRKLKDAGLSHIPAICTAQSEFSQTFANTYLTQHIRFDLGPQEKDAIKSFASLLRKHRFVSDTPYNMAFV